MIYISYYIFYIPYTDTVTGIFDKRFDKKSSCCTASCFTAYFAEGIDVNKWLTKG